MAGCHSAISHNVLRLCVRWRFEIQIFNKPQKMIRNTNVDDMHSAANDAKPLLPAVLICDCSSREHQIIIEHDNEDNLTYCHIHLVKNGFWRRLKAGLKYIFGYKCRYGQWDEFILKPEHANQLRELSELLSQHSR